MVPARIIARLLLTALLLAASLPARPAFAAGDPAELQARREESRAEYDRLLRDAALSNEKLVALTKEVAGLRKDNATLTAALIQAAKTEKKLAGDIAAIEDRLSGLVAQEAGLKASLAERRGVLAEVLGALQRMGLNPPPAILVTPDDALASVRSAILLGAVVPDLRSETKILFDDLTELSRLRASIDAEKTRLARTIGEQAEEKGRLTLLIEEKQRLQSASEAALKAEAARAAELADNAGSLQELIVSLETEIESARAAAEAARLAEEERSRKQAERLARRVPDENRLVASAPFEVLKGQLTFPAAGRVVRRYGTGDGIGGTMLGDTLATQSGAIVTAPSEGSVLYAGPFRSYGQLLILDAGDGYHVVLAGLGRINVTLGQSVLAGEPVGAMGEARLASAAIGTGAASPVNAAPELYVEFRKDGKPVDPTPWWADRSSGRTGNGT